MKYKIISVIAIVFILVSGLVFQSIDIDLNRYHQHLEAEKKPECDEFEEEFCSHLPIISIQTEGALPFEYLRDNLGDVVVDRDQKPVANKEKVSAKIDYFDNKTQNNHLTDRPVVSENALTSIRGASSREFDKKNYNIKFMNEDNSNNKDIGLSDMVEDSDWALHGPYIDKTLIRNYLSYNLAGEIMDYSPNVRFCELFLNGEYQGLYLLTEKINYNTKGRITLTKSDSKLTNTSYIIKSDNSDKDGLYQLNTFTNYIGKNGPLDRIEPQMEIVYPSKTLTQNQRDFIEDDISKFEKALLSYDSADKKLGYPSFIDVEEFVNYFIINEFTMNTDAGRRSTYYYKDIRGKLGVVTWDFDGGFDNYYESLTNPQYFVMVDKMWFDYFLKDKKFTDKVIVNYNNLRKTYLSDEYLLNYIDETVEYLGPAIDRNFEKWGYSFEEEQDKLIGEGRNPRNFEESIKQLKTAIVKRGEYMDKNIETLYAYSHDSINKKFKHVVGE